MLGTIPVNAAIRLAAAFSVNDGSSVIASATIR